MRKRVVLLTALLMLTLFISAMSSPVRPQANEAVYLFYVLDNFEDGDASVNPKWWNFDGVKLAVVDNKDLGGEGEKLKNQDRYSLRVSGKAAKWYVGGFGAYVAKDASKYTHLVLNIYGMGERSGSLSIELYDDDNENLRIEQDPSRQYAPHFDDKFVYTLIIDWTGWKKVTIPIENFRDANPQVGDDIWNPNTLRGSGGLIQAQFIVTSAEEKGFANFYIGEIKLVQFSVP